MPEWIKTLIAACVGSLLTTLAEPIRVAISDWLKCRRMRRALYQEAANGYAFALAARDAHLGPFLKTLLGSFPSYHAALSDPFNFARLREAHLLTGIFQLLPEVPARSDLAKLTASMIEDGIRDGLLDRKLFLACCPPNDRRQKLLEALSTPKAKQSEATKAGQ
jgi:hypothetical protein